MRKFNITVNGQLYQVEVEEVGAPDNAPKVVPLTTPAAAPAITPMSANGTKVLSPFSGTVKNILVENGARVKKDQPILVLEAMKMDNDIAAPCDGVVTVNVTKGASVETDAVLAVIG